MGFVEDNNYVSIYSCNQKKFFPVKEHALSDSTLSLDNEGLYYLPENIACALDSFTWERWHLVHLLVLLDESLHQSSILPVHHQNPLFAAG